LPNTYINNYYLKLEHLTSAYNNLLQLPNHNNLHLVTIQPLTQIWCLEDATKYLNNLLPNKPPLILILEHNDKVTHKLNARYYDLLPTLHLHIIISHTHIHQLQDIVFYKSISELKQIKRNTRLNQLHITARRVFSNEWQNYLLKQSTNTFLPILLNQQHQQKEVAIYNKKRAMKKQVTHTPRLQTHTHINPFNLLQILFAGLTYSQVKYIKQAEQQTNRVKASRLFIKPKINMFQIIFCFMVNNYTPLVQLAKPPPHT